MIPSNLGAITIFGSGRLGPTLTALVGLAGVVLAVRAFARARRTGTAGREGRVEAT